jgi:long-chain fatty acid transport protein
LGSAHHGYGRKGDQGRLSEIQFHKAAGRSGLTGILQYGSLSIDFDQGTTTHVGNGPSDDLGVGFQVGTFVNITKDLTVAASYKSAIDMNYKDQISKAGTAFGYGVTGTNFTAKTDHLEQPAEIGAGISYSIDAVTLALDYKFIQWAEAKGYKDFGWENQSVYSVGARYDQPKYWFGLGFNYSKTPLRENNDNTSMGGGYTNTNGDTMNTFNYVLFPATSETHYTIGAGVEVASGTYIDTAFTYAPETKNTVTATTTGLGEVTTTHSQKAVTVALRYNF